jgi:predicted hydrocarbon binding protein
MHGLVFAQLKRFVVDRDGPERWNEVAAKAGVGSRVYLPDDTYPDEEIMKLVGAAATAASADVQDVLEEFGAYLAPVLLKMYSAQVHPSWKTLDLLLHTEETIHRVVRLRDPKADPPRLKARREGPSKVVVEYSSARRLCSLARGIIQGVAKGYGEKVQISEPECMLKGAKTCQLVVETAS